MATGQRGVEDVLVYLRDVLGVDTAGFSRSAIERAVGRRLAEAGGSPELYRARLRRDPAELARLGHEVIVRYTDFFRDPQEWRWVSEHVVPDLVRAAGGRRLLVWSAGCASGEEAYSLAIAFAEALRRRIEPIVRVLGTDTDEEALAKARAAVYADDELERLPAALRRRYFVPDRAGYRVRREITGAVAFRRHDLTRDGSPGVMDLIVCRHTMMYLSTDDRTRALESLHSGLHPWGRLWLESTDDLGRLRCRFRPVEAGRPVFAKA